MNENLKVKLRNESRNDNPSYATNESAGCDIRANIDTDLTLKPLERACVPTGIYIELPRGYEAQVRPRSGLAAKNGITVLNTPGTIDSDYRGEIRVILVNLSNEPFTIHDGDRIAQLVFAKHETAIFETCESFSETSRGTGGFGHTGVN